MRRLFLRYAVASLVASASLLSSSLCGAQTAALVERSARVSGAVDPGQTFRLSGHVPVYADVNRIPSTAMSTNAKFAHLAVQLSRSPAVEAAFEQLLADQVNPSSARFHQWLTPAQVGTLYGPAQSDVDAVTSWLKSQGLTVNSVSPNRLSIDFGGSVASVEKAFGTSFRVFSLSNGQQRYSLVQEPSVPAALQTVVANIAGLSQVIHRSDAVHHSLAPAANKGASLASPEYTTSTGYHYLTSGDFNTAYDITSTLSSGITGTGQNIAIIGESRVYATDIAQLETMEGIATKQANVIIPSSGVDPGVTGDDAQGEATLDVDRTIGTAPGANIDLVVSTDIGTGSTYATDGLFIALSYAISTVNDPILSISFGGCEALDGAANVNYEASFFTTAASQGISTFVSSGDDGAAGCNFDYSNIPTTQVLSINDLCSSPYVTCVGGTEFAADVNSPSTYWSSTNSSTFTSLQSYIPEGAWNDPYYYQGNYDESSGTGGGTSAYVARPSWQTGTGVPAGSFRLVPDLSFTSSANHDGFIVCLNYASDACTYTGTTITNAAVFGGTSAAAPSMAGVQALINQKMGGRQGNVNPTIYALANAGTGFNDVTTASSTVTSCVATTPSLCNNSTPAYTSLTGGLAGYTVNAGFDEATGWGSMDVGKFIAGLTTVGGFAITPASATITVAPGATGTDVLTLSSRGSFAGAAALTCAVFNVSGSAAGSCSIAPTASTVAAGGTASATLSVTTTSGSAGVFNVIVTGTSGSTMSYAQVGVTVSSSTTATFTMTPSSATLSFTSGATAGNSTVLTLASLNGYAGVVGLTCTLTTSSATYQPTCTLSPSSATLSADGLSSVVVTIGSTKATASMDRKTAPLGWRLGSGVTFALLLCCVPFRKRRRAFGLATMAALLAWGLGAVTGCSQSGGSTAGTTGGGGTTTHSSAGTYTATVTATGPTTLTSTIAVTIN